MDDELLNPITVNGLADVSRPCGVSQACRQGPRHKSSIHPLISIESMRDYTLMESLLSRYAWPPEYLIDDEKRMIKIAHYHRW